MHIKTVDFNRLRTRIIGVEGEHADHWTIVEKLSRVRTGAFYTVSYCITGKQKILHTFHNELLSGYLIV